MLASVKRRGRAGSSLLGFHSGRCVCGTATWTPPRPARPLWPRRLCLIKRKGLSRCFRKNSGPVLPHASYWATSRQAEGGLDFQQLTEREQRKRKPCDGKPEAMPDGHLAGPFSVIASVCRREAISFCTPTSTEVSIPGCLYDLNYALCNKTSSTPCTLTPSIHYSPHPLIYWSLTPPRAPLGPFTLSRPTPTPANCLRPAIGRGRRGEQHLHVPTRQA